MMTVTKKGGVTELDEKVAHTTLNASAEDIHKARQVTQYKITLKVGGNIVIWDYNSCNHPIHELTQMGLAERITDIAKDHVFYDSDRGVWYVWQGQYWLKLNKKSESQLFQIATQLPEMLRVEVSQNLISRLGAQMTGKKDIERFIRSAGSKAVLSASFSLAKASNLLGKGNVQYNIDPYRITLGNGEIQIAELKGTQKVKGARQLEDYKQDNHNTNFIPVQYDAKATCPLFMSFLKSVTNDDKSLAQYLQLLAGDALLGDNEYQHLTFLQGPANTGKSTLLKIWAGVLGAGVVDEDLSYAVTGIPFELFTSHKGSDPNSNTPVLAQLAGKHMVMPTEPKDGEKLEEGFVKSITGGDDVKAQQKYEMPFSFHPGFSILTAANDLPKSSASDAIMRRLIVVPLDHVVKSNSLSYDSNIAKKIIETEAPGVLNWMLQGAERLTDINIEQKKKSEDLIEKVKAGKASPDTKVEKDPLVLEMPESVKAMRLKYQTEANSGSEFLFDCLMSRDGFWNYLSTGNALDTTKPFKASFDSHGNAVGSGMNHYGRYEKAACLVADPTTYTTAAALYELYRDVYAKREGIKYPLTQRMFNKAISQYLPSARTHQGKSWLGIGIGPSYSYGRYDEGSYGQSIDNLRWKIDKGNRQRVTDLTKLYQMLTANRKLTKSQAKKVESFVHANSEAFLGRLYKREATLVNPATGQEVKPDPDFDSIFDTDGSSEGDLK